MVVVFGHTNIDKNHSWLNLMNGDGGVAVQSFFIISGFYMALIAEKYQLQQLTLNNLTNFYLSRFFRIYPLYFIVVILTFILSTIDITSIGHSPFKTLTMLASWPDKLLYVFSNIFIFGQGIMRFLVLNPETHMFYFNALNDYVDPNLLGSGFQIIGQSWTLSLELTFYLLAPFLVTRSVTLLIPLCLATFFLRYWLFLHHYQSYNINVALFPTSLGLFLMGSIIYKIMREDISKMSSETVKKIAWLALGVVLMYGLYLFPKKTNYELKHWTFIFLITITIPFLFAGFKNSKLDNFIGELSYPVYMTQFICLGFVTKYIQSDYIVYYIIAASTLFSTFINIACLNPIDKLRHRIFLKSPKSQTQNKKELIIPDLALASNPKQ